MFVQKTLLKLSKVLQLRKIYIPKVIVINLWDIVNKVNNMQNTQQWFDYILNSQWVVLGNNTLIQPQRNSDGTWILGDIITNDQEILTARPLTNLQDIKEFQLVHQSWKVAIFKKYKPIIYFCAFGKDAIFECVYTSIQSLIEFGNWQHEIVVFTAENTKEYLQDKLSSLGLGNKLHMITILPATDTLDWVMARYRINHPILQQAQPLLYMDTDIICNAPLDDFFIKLIDSPLVHACQEGLIGEGSPQSGGYWYGWRLMQEDNVPFNPQNRGFSAGALFFNNVKSVLPFFEMILQSTYGFMDKQGYRDEFYDQRFTNYILFKFKKVEIIAMSKLLNLYRIPPETTLIPNGNQTLGLVHFLNASTENKLITMKKYVDMLRLRANKQS
ncbi:unnamed protein product [Commensalibacter communis]|nr:unnamed protein product [Commensalibacter communis]